MKIVRVFQRVPEPIATENVLDELEPWLNRIEQLVLSDPRELLSLVSDALIAVAAQFEEDDPEAAWALALSMVEKSTNTPELNQVIQLVRKRFQQLVAIAAEQTSAPSLQIKEAFWKASSKAPWPED